MAQWFAAKPYELRSSLRDPQGWKERSNSCKVLL